MISIINLNIYYYGILNNTNNNYTILVLVNNINLNAITNYKEKAFN